MFMVRFSWIGLHLYLNISENNILSVFTPSDVTLAYSGPEGFGKAPNLVTINSISQLSPKYKFHIHTRRWAIRELPEDEGDLKTWIETVWMEKDEILDGLKKEWINWKGLVGWGAKTSGRSGACGVYRDALYRSPPKKSAAKMD